MQDKIITFAQEGESRIEISRSVFIGNSKEVSSAGEAEEFVSSIRAKYPDARHVCYAWRTSGDTFMQKYSDDGEPSSTAGRPIHGQLLSQELSDILVVVVRYFGGIKLGIPGLIRAYKTSSADALSQAAVIEKIAARRFRLHFDYLSMNAVMKVLKEMDLPQSGQQFGEECSLEVRVRLSALEDFRQRIGEHAKLEEI